MQPYSYSLHKGRAKFSDTSVGSSVAKGGGGGSYSPPHWYVDLNAKWEKHYVFSTFVTVLWTGVD